MEISTGAVRMMSRKTVLCFLLHACDVERTRRTAALYSLLQYSTLYYYVVRVL